MDMCKPDVLSSRPRTASRSPSTHHIGSSRCVCVSVYVFTIATYHKFCITPIEHDYTPFHGRLRLQSVYDGQCKSRWYIRMNGTLVGHRHHHHHRVWMREWVADGEGGGLPLHSNALAMYGFWRRLVVWVWMDTVGRNVGVRDVSVDYFVGWIQQGRIITTVFTSSVHSTIY